MKRVLSKKELLTLHIARTKRIIPKWDGKNYSREGASVFHITKALRWNNQINKLSPPSTVISYNDCMRQFKKMGAWSKSYANKFHSRKMKHYRSKRMKDERI